jgi:flagellar hook-length control protein FliK
MDFTIPAKALTLLAPGKNTNNPDLSLKTGQQLEAKVLNISIENNIIELQLGKTSVKVAVDPPLTPQTSTLPQFTKGEQLTLLVNKLLPNPELSLERPALATQNQSKLPASVENEQLTQTANGIKSKPLVLKILFATTDLPVSTQKNSTERLSFFEKGQQVTARIVSIENGSLKLELLSDPKKNNSGTELIKPSSISVPLEKISPSQSFMVKSDLPQLKTGQLISLEITKTGNQPSFKILETQHPVFSAESEKKLTETIRRFLPVQQSPAIFIEKLANNQPLLIANKTVPEALKQLAQQILHQLPKKTALTNPLGLKQSIDNSGLFLESKLLQSEDAPVLKSQADFKATTLKFIQALKQQASIPLPSELKNTEHETLNLKQLQNDAESSMAKMILDQIASLPKEESIKQVWQLELPYLSDQKTIENIVIEIEHDKNKQEQPENDNWTVNITLDPPRLGKLHCKISCISGTINTHFWSHSSETNHLVSQNLDFLKSRLEASGLKTGQIKAHNSPPESFKKVIEYPHKLIDEKI